MNVGDKVTFNQGDENHTVLTGTVSRVWSDGRTVTVKAPGSIAGSVRTFVRMISEVTPIV